MVGMLLSNVVQSQKCRWCSFVTTIQYLKNLNCSVCSGPLRYGQIAKTPNMYKTSTTSSKLSHGLESLAVESGTRGLLCRKLLGEVEVNNLRGRICGALRKSKPHSTNMTKEQKSALKDLRAMEAVTILPADKGNATVVKER